MATSLTDLPIVHKITEFYKDVYRLGINLPKRDKYGVHLRIEQYSLDMLTLGIEAALKTKEEKKLFLQQLRTKVETLKHLVRISHELKIVDQKIYITLESKLQEISKMAYGWMQHNGSSS
jgi:hypothetical protein